MKAKLKQLTTWVGRHPVARRLMFEMYRRRAIGQPSDFDKEMGVDTDGSLPSFVLQSGRHKVADKTITAYFGISPPALRLALDQIDQLDNMSFVDLGAGKGRACIVASEYSFRDIVGIELSTDLCHIARRNARRVATLHPERPVIGIVAGDATQAPWPPGSLVIFMFHPFNASLVEAVAKRLEKTAHSQTTYLVYANPVYSSAFDLNPAFQRWSALQITETEKSESPLCVVTWIAGARPDGIEPDPGKPRTGRDRPIHVTLAGWRAELGA